MSLALILCLGLTLIFCSTFELNQFLASEAAQVGSIFDDLHSSLTTQQGEFAALSRDLRHVCGFSSASAYLVL